MRRTLLDIYLIDFFCTVGLSKDIIVDIIHKIEVDRDGDYSSELTYSWLKKYLDNNVSLQKNAKDMNINFYPDCLKQEGKMNKDPRFLTINKD